MSITREDKWLQLLSHNYERQILDNYSNYLIGEADSNSLLSYESTKQYVTLKKSILPQRPWFYATVLFKDMWKIKDFLKEYVRYTREPYYLSSCDKYCSLRSYLMSRISMLNLDFSFETGNGLLIITSFNLKEEIVIDWYESNCDYYIDLMLYRRD